VDCVVNPLPLRRLPIVGQSDKKAKAMMHGDEGIGVDGLKELDPDPSTHDGIMEHGPIHVPPLPVTSNHVIPAFQQGHQTFSLAKVKTTNGNTNNPTYPFSVNPLVAEPLDYGENLFHYAGIQHMRHFTCFVFYILFCKALQMMGSDKIHTASHTYVHVMSLCHLYPLPVT
jgi:hypothetical protein